MTRMTRIINVPAVAMALLLGVVLGYQALAQRAVAPAAPVMATVRIERLFDGLQQRAEAKVEVARLEQQMTDERNRREQELKQLEVDLEDAVESAARKELKDEIALKRLKLQFWFQEANTVIEVEKALQLQDMYKNIKEAIAALAGAEGYDVVIINDESQALPFDREARISPQVQVLQQISNRKMLYLNPAIDITEDLIERMNNAFRAG